MPNVGEPTYATDVVTSAGTPGLVTVDSASISTTETVIVSDTVSVVSGEVYGILLKTSASTSVNTAFNVATPTFEIALVRIREDSVTGNQLTLDLLLAPSLATNGYPLMAYVEYTATSTGSKTFVATLIRSSGTGNWVVRAASNRATTLRVTHLVD